MLRIPRRQCPTFLIWDQHAATATILQLAPSKIKCTVRFTCKNICISYQHTQKWKRIKLDDTRDCFLLCYCHGPPTSYKRSARWTFFESHGTILGNDGGDPEDLKAPKRRSLIQHEPCRKETCQQTLLHSTWTTILTLVALLNNAGIKAMP